MMFLAFLYDILIMKPNQWFDSLPEPNRFLTFIVPLGIIILTLSYYDLVVPLFIILIGTFFYRLCYMNSNSRKKNE